MVEKKKGKLTEEEFNKLPQKERDRILEQRKKNKEALEAKSEMNLSSFSDNTTETELVRTFNKSYKVLRDNTVILMAKKKTGENIKDICEELYNTVSEVSEKLKDVLGYE